MRTGSDRSGTERIRLVLVDDHTLVVDSVVRLLEAQPDMTVIATAGTVAAAMAALEHDEPDIVVLDYQLPDGDGATAAVSIAERWPAIRVIMLTGSGGDAVAFEAARAHCAGFLDKTRAADELVQMIRTVREGASDLPADQIGLLPQIDDLVVHYQPIVRLGTREIVGFEALVRWDHPSRGLLPPGEFIPLAETASVIHDIGDRVRLVAATQAVTWGRRYPSRPLLTMSVNLSGRELMSADLTARVARTLEDTGISPALLVLEVTETFLIGDPADAVGRLEQLKALGIRLALDDFGSGYSSLGYLREFPIDIIKLDRTFTSGLPDGERERQIVEAVGRLAADIGALAEAEGVETAEQADCLAELGWDLAQGFHFARPAPAGVAESLLTPGLA